MSYASVTEEGFKALVERALDTKVYKDERTMGQRFSLSQTTMVRWRKGRTVPGPTARRMYARVIMRDIESAP